MRENPLLAGTTLRKVALALNQRALVRAAREIGKRNLNKVVFPETYGADVIRSQRLGKHQIAAARARTLRSHFIPQLAAPRSSSACHSVGIPFAEPTWPQERPACRLPENVCTRNGDIPSRG